MSKVGRVIVRIIVVILVFALGGAAVLLALAAGCLDSARIQPTPGQWGLFLSAPRVELLDDGRQLRLLEDFVYIDPQKKVWLAPKGSIVDGASIPQVFWSLIGGPLEGPYRNASIPHDVECERKREKWEDVHFMFYQACRCGGLGETQAKVMYWAVYQFGPRWQLASRMTREMVTLPDGSHEPRTFETRSAVPERSTRNPPAEILEKAKRYIGQHNPSLDELRRLDPGRL
jgi:hypothetical protein